VLAVAYDVTVTTPRSEREPTFIVRVVGREHAVPNRDRTATAGPALSESTGPYR